MLKRFSSSVFLAAVLTLSVAPAFAQDAAPPASVTVVQVPAAAPAVSPAFVDWFRANKPQVAQLGLLLLALLGPSIIVACNKHPGPATNALKSAILLVLARFSVLTPTDSPGTLKLPLVASNAPPQNLGAKAGMVSLLFLFCLPQTACVTGWTAAEKAAPACYALNGASLSTLIAEGKAVALDAAQCGALATCPAAVEAALSTYLADKALDDQAYQCVSQAIALEIKYPQGGEAPYSPPSDAGTPEAPSALTLALAMSPQQKSALVGIAALQAKHVAVVK